MDTQNQVLQRTMARLDAALADAPGGDKAWVPLRRGDLVAVLRLLQVMPVVVDAALQVMAALGDDGSVSATAIVGGHGHMDAPQPLAGTNGRNGQVTTIPAPQAAVTVVTKPKRHVPAPDQDSIDLAIVRAALDRGTLAWRRLPKKIRRDLLGEQIRRVAVKGKCSQSEFNAAKPDWMATAVAATVTLNLDWQDLIRQALGQVEPETAATEVAVAPDSFRS